MPTLEDIREWLRGRQDGKAHGLPSLHESSMVSYVATPPVTAPEPSLSPNAERMLQARLKEKMRGKYTIATTGDDAVIKFGKYAGSSLSELAKTTESISYMRWMLTQEFPDELLSVVRHLLKIPKK